MFTQCILPVLTSTIIYCTPPKKKSGTPSKIKKENWNEETEYKKQGITTRMYAEVEVKRMIGVSEEGVWLPMPLLCGTVKMFSVNWTFRVWHCQEIVFREQEVDTLKLKQ